MKKNAKSFFLLSAIFLVLFFFSGARSISAQSCDSSCPSGDSACLNNRIADCHSKLSTLQGQANTLSNQIAQFNAQIKLMELKISQTEEEIALLSGRIDQLGSSLGSLSTAFASRAVETYRMSRSAEVPLFVLTSNNLSELFTRFHYLRLIQEADRDLLIRLQRAQNIYKDEKTEAEALQRRLEEQRTALTSQKAAKANLLAVTKNDEKRYQQILDQAQKELEALAQSQFTGKRDVKRGEVVGIMGSTGFSTGAHLHFGYYNLTESQHNVDFKGNVGWYFSRHESPVSALQAKSLYFEKLSCDDVPQGLTKSIGSGSFPWPMSNPRITQCYGHTPYSSVYPGNFHHGLDMADTSDKFVRAADDGVAYFYRGSSSFGNNIRIFHGNGKMSLYLHLQ